MPNEALIKNGTSITWASSGADYGISLESVANNAAAQGAKGDLGATRAKQYAVILYWETNTAPTAGTYVEVWWSSSTSATAGTDNMGGALGTDSAYRASDEDEWKKQLIPIGNLVCTNDGSTVQKQLVGYLVNPLRYGMPIVVNKSGQTSSATTTNFKVLLEPVVDELQ